MIKLLSKTYSLLYRKQSSSTKEKGITKKNRAKHEEYYNALIYNKEKALNENRLQKIR